MKGTPTRPRTSPGARRRRGQCRSASGQIPSRRRKEQVGRARHEALEDLLHEVTVETRKVPLGQTTPHDEDSGIRGAPSSPAIQGLGRAKGHGGRPRAPATPVPPLELRLLKRYLILVESHMRSAPELAAGVASLPSTRTAFAATQAAWRFLNNDRVPLPALVEPLREAGRSQVEALESRFTLVVHDWSKLKFNQPKRKRDLLQLTHATDVGYELMTALLVSADDGTPLAPMEIHLETADGVLSTRDPAPKQVPHQDQILETMRASRLWKLTKSLLHVIDREADSVDHYRQWDGEGFKFLVRADDRRVNWFGKSLLLTEIRRSLRRRKAFSKVTEDAKYQGRPAELWVAETDVILDRPAKKNVRGKRFERAGRPLPLRYIVVQLRDGTGRVLAEWMLLTNAPKRATAEHLARCYYWRWQIESYHKLLKSHGQQLEQWQQATGIAIARRLLVASMACVLVWQLEADDSEEAKELKDIVIRLSGRQMKSDHPHTAPALLAGLWVLLSMLELLEYKDLDHIRRLAARIRFLNSG
jgi:Transposase DDE domain